ncbi:hypothetical protein BaRGS_00010583, partial [Batillaria attramentaria]
QEVVQYSVNPLYVFATQFPAIDQNLFQIQNIPSTGFKRHYTAFDLSRRVITLTRNRNRFWDLAKRSSQKWRQRGEETETQVTFSIMLWPGTILVGKIKMMCGWLDITAPTHPPLPPSPSIPATHLPLSPSFFKHNNFVLLNTCKRNRNKSSGSCDCTPQQSALYLDTGRRGEERAVQEEAPFESSGDPFRWLQSY